MARGRALVSDLIGQGRRDRRRTLSVSPDPTRPAPHVVALAVMAAIGCYGSIGGRLVTPSGFEPEGGGGDRTCPELGGVYLAQSSAQAADSWLRVEPDRTVKPRHLSQFFTGLDGAERLERVAVRESSGQLTLEFRGEAGDARRLVLREGTDFRCGDGRYRLLGSARVKHRRGATVHVYRGPGGALVAETLIDSPTGWLLLLPVVVGKQDGQWSSHPAVEEPR